MGRLKRTSLVSEKADMRLQGIKSISATLDLGNGLSAAAFETMIEETQNILDQYNQMLSLLDEKVVILKNAEKQLAAFSERMMAGIAAKYGKDSAEYAQAGGTRKSDYKRSSKKTATK